MKKFRIFLEERIPKVKYWEYESSLLIPGEIAYEEFMAENNPEANNTPLYNMFRITERMGIESVSDLEKKIAQWQQNSGSRRKDSGFLTNSVNKHIKSIWEDFDQELKIELEETKITIHVNDPKSPSGNYYDMSMRSQGFKTFISFILTISAEVKTGSLSNYILILDEPETHLHPSGVKYMKQELLKLADRNKVFFATHSIFMIDRSCLPRHILVSKKNEKTLFTAVTRNNILQEDVIYQALGTSVDEFSIGLKNIVFEGELDLKLFKFFAENCLEKKKNPFRDVELLDGGGTKSITKFFKNKTIPRESLWHFVLDNDAAGRNLSKNLENEMFPEQYEKCKFIPYSSIIDEELEDLLPTNTINEAFVGAIEASFSIQFELELEQPGPISKILEEFYGRNSLGSNKKKVEATFKENLEVEVNKLLSQIYKEKTIKEKRMKYQELLPNYFDFLVKVFLEFETDISTM